MSKRAGPPKRGAPAIPDPRGPGPQGASVPIVGIGASAGGLEALDAFFKNWPRQSGMACVVVQHLDPTHKGILVELLQRVTPMPVLQVRDRMQVAPNHVYVIPPNSDMSVLHGALHLVPQSSPRGLNLPIDVFFRSLAEDEQERSVGVILSGMGSDGTLGLRAIKEKAGAAFVQSLSSARFDGMPRSVIEAGLADIVAPAEELPAKILAYLRHARHLGQPETTVEDRNQSALDKVFVLLRAQTGNDFSFYKRSTIYRRIERRMGLHQIDTLLKYVRYLRENPREIDLLFKELLIGVTSFFRDPEAWAYLKKEVLPTLLDNPAGGILRAWVPGCSTGEEAYSLAITFREALDAANLSRPIGLQIFATDLDREAIERARLGVYPDNVAADVSPEQLDRFFVRGERGYRVAKEIREMVVFAPQNIIMDPSFTKLDILCCRNLLIYLSADLQKKLIPLFHYSLKPGGILFLGSAETVGAFTGLFAPFESKFRLYRRLDQSVVGAPVEFRPAFLTLGTGAQGDGERLPEQEKATPPNLQALADRVLVQRFAPVAILCNDKGDILYISAKAGKYLEPAVGKANLNVFAMAREGLRYELSNAFSKALRSDGPVLVRGLALGTNGGAQSVDLTVQKLSEPKELRGTVMVSLADVPPEPAAAKAARTHRVSEPPRIRELEHQIQRARDEVRTTRDEMQTSQEELKSSNEELQSTNEELQSTNEELTTSKEEMQSLNEELQTVNQELQSKVDELSRSNNDMKNLLNSTDIATLFLDGELCVRRFTTPTARIIKLIPGDAGRRVTDIASIFEYPDLAADSREVLRTLIFKEKQVTTRDGRWFTVRIMPYRTLENVIDGVVITFTDISAARTLEAALREQAGQLRQMAESLPNLVWGCNADGACDYISVQWSSYTGLPEKEQLGYGWLEQVHPEDRDRVQKSWRASVNKGNAFDVELRLRSASGEYRWFKARSVPIRDSQAAIVKWYGTATDVDDLKRAQEERSDSLPRLSAVLDDLGEGFFALDEHLTVTFFNAAAERLFGRKREQVVGRRIFEAIPGLQSSALGEKLRQVSEARAPLVFDAELGAPPRRHRARLYPLYGPDGLSAFFEQPPDNSKV